jgi:hypothetical protein
VADRAFEASFIDVFGILRRSPPAVLVDAKLAKTRQIPILRRTGTISRGSGRMRPIVGRDFQIVEGFGADRPRALGV